MFEGYFIQYKFILPAETQHSSYTYQKLFRAIYGYTQKVTKSSGKSYTYYRKGILSDVPYIRPGKNAVIIPKEAFTELISFFNTGKNPSHHWKTKGDWKAVYYMDEKKLEEPVVLKALEGLIDRTHVCIQETQFEKLLPSMRDIIEKTTSGQEIDKARKEISLKAAQNIISKPWLRELKEKPKKITELIELYNKIK